MALTLTSPTPTETAPSTRLLNTDRGSVSLCFSRTKVSTSSVCCTRICIHSYREFKCMHTHTRTCTRTPPVSRNLYCRDMGWFLLPAFTFASNFESYRVSVDLCVHSAVLKKPCIILGLPASLPCMAQWMKRCTQRLCSLLSLIFLPGGRFTQQKTLHLKPVKCLLSSNQSTFTMCTCGWLVKCVQCPTP